MLVMILNEEDTGVVLRYFRKLKKGSRNVPGTEW